MFAAQRESVIDMSDLLFKGPPPRLPPTMRANTCPTLRTFSMAACVRSAVACSTVAAPKRCGRAQVARQEHQLPVHEHHCVLVGATGPVPHEHNGILHAVGDRVCTVSPS